MVLALEIFNLIVLQRNTRMAPLLRAVMNKPVLTDVQVTAARVTAPVVRQPVNEVSLEAVGADESGEGTPRIPGNLFVDSPLTLVKRTKLSTTAVNDPNCAVEAEFSSTLRYGEGLLRPSHATTENRVDIDVELGILGEPLQLLVQDLQALL